MAHFSITGQALTQLARDQLLEQNWTAAEHFLTTAGPAAYPKCNPHTQST